MGGSKKKEKKKKNNTKVIKEKMAKTFYQRIKVVSGSPAVDDFRDRWHALFYEAEVSGSKLK